MKITTLVDNHAGNGLRAEHGLSLWIECDGRHVLFDTGQSDALLTNARLLDIDLAQADYIVLSHGHYDHTGGIAPVLEIASHAEVYLHPAAPGIRYSIQSGKAKPIHMPREAVAALDALPPGRYHRVLGPRMVTARIGVSGPIPRETRFESTGGPFYLDPEGALEDPIEDDLALWAESDEGLVVCVGYSHAGIVNTLSYIQRLAGTTKVRAVIGGFHLLGAAQERMEHTVAALRSLRPHLLITCHCTGEEATAALRKSLGSRVLAGSAGHSYQF